MKFNIPGELPDMNQIVKVSKAHPMAYSNLKRRNTHAVALQASNLPKLDRINLTITWHCKDKRKDKDNIAVGTKFILDGLVEADVIENDGWKQIGNITHRFDVDKQNPRVEVEIEEVSA